MKKLVKWAIVVFLLLGSGITIFDKAVELKPEKEADTPAESAYVQVVEDLA